jgi:hypothetical protein
VTRATHDAVPNSVSLSRPWASAARARFSASQPGNRFAPAGGWTIIQAMEASPASEAAKALERTRRLFIISWVLGALVVFTTPLTLNLTGGRANADLAPAFIFFLLCCVPYLIAAYLLWTKPAAGAKVVFILALVAACFVIPAVGLATLLAWWAFNPLQDLFAIGFAASLFYLARSAAAARRHMRVANP